MNREEFRERAVELLSEGWFSSSEIPSPETFADRLMPLYDETLDGKVEGFAKAALRSLRNDPARGKDGVGGRHEE